MIKPRSIFRKGKLHFIFFFENRGDSISVTKITEIPEFLLTKPYFSCFRTVALHKRSIGRISSFASGRAPGEAEEAMYHVCVWSKDGRSMLINSSDSTDRKGTGEYTIDNFLIQAFSYEQQHRKRRRRKSSTDSYASRTNLGPCPVSSW
jgi:hypothetical protein